MLLIRLWPKNAFIVSSNRVEKTHDSLNALGRQKRAVSVPLGIPRFCFKGLMMPRKSNWGRQDARVARKSCVDDLPNAPSFEPLTPQGMVWRRQSRHLFTSRIRVQPYSSSRHITHCYHMGCMIENFLLDTAMTDYTL